MQWVYSNRITVINVQMTCQQYIIQDVYENGNKVCIIAFAQNFIHAKLFKLCLKSWSTVEFIQWVYSNRIIVINMQMTCQQFIIQDVYENGNKVCIKAFAINFIDDKLFKFCLKSWSTVEFIQWVYSNRIIVINMQMTCQQFIIWDVYENGNKVCIKASALNFVDTKGF